MTPVWLAIYSVDPWFTGQYGMVMWCVLAMWQQPGGGTGRVLVRPASAGRLRQHHRQGRPLLWSRRLPGQQAGVVTVWCSWQCARVCVCACVRACVCARVCVLVSVFVCASALWSCAYSVCLSVSIRFYICWERRRGGGGGGGLIKACQWSGKCASCFKTIQNWKKSRRADELSKKLHVAVGVPKTFINVNCFPLADFSVWMK